MQVAVTPTGTDRSAITNPKGTSPGQSLLELSSVGGDRHRQRQFESPSNSFQLTVTHSVSSGLERILSSFVDSRRETRRSLSAAPSRPPLLLSVASALLFLVLDAIFSANQSSRRANQIFEPKIFLPLQRSKRTGTSPLGASLGASESPIGQNFGNDNGAKATAPV